ncbi:MAG: TlpA family protein disulfide reductase [Candidatus Eremiobacteraeota bacterium]|nr:TlpA family protein disulfide reductase [Candidatus Eremiobacteraeota bacterium]
MNQRLLAIISIAVLIVLVCGAVLYMRLRPSAQLSNASQPPAVGTAHLGAQAPQFTAATTAGLFDLSTIDKPVFLEVFATWCPHCQRETVTINKLYGEFSSQVSFIAIPGSDTAMDGTSPSSQNDVLKFVQKFHVRYPIAAYDQSLTVANMYLQGGFPTVAIIRKNKMISYLNSGEITFAELESEIKKAM